MDEYLFIEVAKLQADRRRLEREQQAAHVIDVGLPRSDEYPALERRRQPARPSWLAPIWRKQS